VRTTRTGKLDQVGGFGRRVCSLAPAVAILIQCGVRAAVPLTRPYTAIAFVATCEVGLIGVLNWPFTRVSTAGPTPLSSRITPADERKRSDRKAEHYDSGPYHVSWDNVRPVDRP
jgi:hypothetical protein